MLTIPISDCRTAEQKTFGKRTLFERLAILTYELGAVSRNIVHGEGSADPVMRGAYLADAVVELSDLVTQAHLLLLDLTEEKGGLQWSWDRLQQEGIERQLLRMSEWAKRRFEQMLKK
jgi:hypothetical protein